MGFAGSDGDPGLAIGFIENDFAIGRILASSVVHEQRNGMNLVTEAALNQEFVVAPGATARSGRFALQIGPGPELPHDSAGYSVVAMQNGLTRIHVNFRAQTEIPWRLNFKRTVG
jgi:hypothetical protein